MGDINKEVKRIVEQCEANIVLFGEAIEKEIATIKEYRGYRTSENNPYDETSLVEGEERCRQNIATFEEAIEKERATMTEQRRIEQYLKDKPEPEVHIEVVRELES
jgi:hypothetical protein